MSAALPTGYHIVREDKGDLIIGTDYGVMNREPPPRFYWQGKLFTKGPLESMRPSEAESRTYCCLRRYYVDTSAPIQMK